MINMDNLQIYTSRSTVEQLRPVRDTEGHKGTFGKLLIIAGCVNMAGAAVLAARAAYRTGAGMVKVISPRANREIIQISVPEALYLPSESPVEDWNRAFDWADAIVIGPGLGTDEVSVLSFEKLLSNYRRVKDSEEKPILIDADALNLIASGRIKPEFFNAPVIMTPHEGELVRLINSVLPNDKVGRFGSCEERIAAAFTVAETYSSIVVSKSADTYIVVAGSEKVFKNDRGNCLMATAGSGDVLSGCIGGLLAQGLTPPDAAKNGVMLHALAGDTAAQSHPCGLLAGDIAEYIGV